MPKWFQLYGALALVLVALTVGAHDLALESPSLQERPLAVMKVFPATPEIYTKGCSELLEAGVLDKYGRGEWTAIVLTHEFHQHVGMYTILGAKMAVRAREILQAPMRAVAVRAETGHDQPLSCAVDGLQVGLGSTLGQNLITVLDAEQPKLAATFEFAAHRVRLSLKEEWRAKIDEMVMDARDRYGDLTQGYFDAIERASYQVWKDFDRSEIFEIEVLT